MWSFCFCCGGGFLYKTFSRKNGFVSCYQLHHYLYTGATLRAVNFQKARPVAVKCSSNLRQIIFPHQRCLGNCFNTRPSHFPHSTAFPVKHTILLAHFPFPVTENSIPVYTLYICFPFYTRHVMLLNWLFNCLNFVSCS